MFIVARLIVYKNRGESYDCDKNDGRAYIPPNPLPIQHRKLEEDIPNRDHHKAQECLPCDGFSLLQIPNADQGCLLEQIPTLMG
jgi:hypothetical protein